MAIYSGETVNDAIEKGLKDLEIDKKHAKISVIQEPKPGILGKFSKEAKVEIIILTDADLETKKKLIKFGIIGGIAVFLIILLSIGLNRIFETTFSSDNSEIKVPDVSSELATQNYESVVKKESAAGKSTSESSIENSINDSQEQTESSSSIENKNSESIDDVTDKLQYTVTKKENQNIITGDVAMTGGDGTKVNVVISADNIKPGTYSVTWTPGVIGGSDPSYGYGLIYINDDPNTIQIMPEESMVVTFNEGDTITFQFAGKGKNDRIRLIQE